MSTFYPAATLRHSRGVQTVYRFPNGYGASLLADHDTHTGGPDGTWEIAVVEFSGPSAEKFEAIFDTPITPTPDVLRYLAYGDVPEVLARIAALPAKEMAR